MDVANELDRRARDRASLVWHALFKRILDVVLSSLLLIFLAPVLMLCAVIIRLDSWGPVVFHQHRVGKNGRPFTMHKFRTMYPNSEQSVHRNYQTAHINGQAPPHMNSAGAVFKLVNDKRVTPAGRWLRRTSLDELPQLWNVLRGEMSLVGPRPALPFEVEQYKPHHLERLAVKPGLTGLWQTSGRNTTSFEEMIALDVTYVREQSLALDLVILLKTFPVVFFGWGA